LLRRATRDGLGSGADFADAAEALLELRPAAQRLTDDDDERARPLARRDRLDQPAARERDDELVVRGQMGGMAPSSVFPQPLPKKDL
jgi:hypothetical protein